MTFRQRGARSTTRAAETPGFWSRSSPSPHSPNTTPSTCDRDFLVHMHHLGRRKAVEIRAAGRGISAYVFGVEQIAHFQVRELLSHADGIEGVARGAEDRANLGGTLLEAFKWVLAMVKDHAAKRLIYAIINVVAKLAAANGLAYDLGDSVSGGGDQETARLSEDFDWFGEKTVQFSVNHFGDFGEVRNRYVIVSRETATDIEEFEIEATRFGFLENARCQVERIAVILRVCALAANVEA